MRRFIGAALLALGPLAVAAQDAPQAPADPPVTPWGSRDFTFHRVGVPQPGGKPRLVQIDPNETPYHLTPATPGGVYLKYTGPKNGTKPAIGSADWFWAGVSPSLAASNPQRLDQAIGQLGLAKDTVVPAKAGVAQLVRRYGASAARQSKGTVVSPALVLAVMSVESGGDGKALSPAGAQGLMQLMPATARRFGVDDPNDPDQSIGGGVAYLNFLLRAFGEDPILALAGYNAGEGAVAQNKGVPPYAETRAYVPKVLGAWTVARLFCKIPPRTVSDPCDFAPVPDDGKAAVASAAPAPSAEPVNVPKDAVKGFTPPPQFNPKSGFAAGGKSLAGGASPGGSG